MGVQLALGPALHNPLLHSQPALAQVLPHSTERPQPSPMVPQYWSPLAVVQLWGVQLAVGPALQTPLSHDHPALGQVVPQSSVPPQPSPMAPQYLSPLAVSQVSGTQVDGPLHMLLLQVHPGLSQVVPQSNWPPHLSPMTPQ
jgi:hypothetical protein